MNNKERQQMRARDAAADLSHVAMRLQRCKESSIDGLLKEADLHLNHFKMAKLVMNAGPTESITELIPDELSTVMESLAAVIRENIDPAAYALFVFGRSERGGQLAYVSNAERDDLAQVLREFIVAHEAGK